MRTIVFGCLLLLAARPALGQDETAPQGETKPEEESKLKADFRGEKERFDKSCGNFTASSFMSCAELLFTDHPLHIAVGSIAPENGFGAGVALVAHYTPNDAWRLSWDTDAIGSNNGSWRAGVYMKAVYTGPKQITEEKGRPKKPAEQNPAILKRPFINFYTQAMSLNKIDYFGLGPGSLESNRTFFGMREITPGVTGILPVPQSKWLNLSLIGELNGRVVDLRGSSGQPSPSIEKIFTEATAPGLTTQLGFAQFGQGIELQPSYGDRIKLNYLANFQQFVAAGDSRFSFRRFTVDLGHEYLLHKTTRSLAPRTQNGPDDCSEDAQDPKHACPGITRALEGSISLRLLISESIAPAGHVVPFYFQPTLGGGDLNGNTSLASYQDYRFRAPNLLLLRGTFEHSIYGPLGFSFGVDEGKVALTRDEIDFTHLAHSYSAGLTLRAGGFPMIFVLFVWGGHEGTHTIALMNTSLLGGSARPSLF